MSTVNVSQFKSGEILANKWQDIVWYVMTLCPANKESRSFVPCFTCISKGEVPHIVKTRGQYFDRNPKLKMVFLRRADQVCEKKLPYGQGLNKHSEVSVTES